MSYPSSQGNCIVSASGSNSSLGASNDLVTTTTPSYDCVEHPHSHRTPQQAPDDPLDQNGATLFGIVDGNAPMDALGNATAFCPLNVGYLSPRQNNASNYEFQGIYIPSAFNSSSPFEGIVAQSPSTTPRHSTLPTLPIPDFFFNLPALTLASSSPYGTPNTDGGNTGGTPGYGLDEPVNVAGVTLDGAQDRKRSTSPRFRWNPRCDAPGSSSYQPRYLEVPAPFRSYDTAEEIPAEGLAKGKGKGRAGGSSKPQFDSKDARIFTLPGVDQPLAASAQRWTQALSVETYCGQVATPAENLGQRVEEVPKTPYRGTIRANLERIEGDVAGGAGSVAHERSSQHDGSLDAHWNMGLDFPWAAMRANYSLDPHDQRLQCEFMHEGPSCIRLLPPQLLPPRILVSQPSLSLSPAPGISPVDVEHSPSPPPRPPTAPAPVHNFTFLPPVIRKDLEGQSYDSVRRHMDKKDKKRKTSPSLDASPAGSPSGMQQADSPVAGPSKRRRATKTPAASPERKRKDRKSPGAA
ncbi:uncharacterized protein BXZ73DRAFT_104347 [Epithele typhae]|uniref:uncharacterized protein n=1 Tax=Epithele typhae TaxID=378194 RepID=UPI002007725D|nr:uncharacterized protein BXZ73DRAFT_104347 [Epithele typhae]KAH9921728.1 hypothetical protein BXZ73DRAFT_104347 [Epithele typhae]